MSRIFILIESPELDRAFHISQVEKKISILHHWSKTASKTKKDKKVTEKVVPQANTETSTSNDATDK